jgi:transcriptional regulator with XRE-family HTH domain
VQNVRRRRAPGAQTDPAFRTWLRELRERAGLTQEELAIAVGTDRRNIRRWEVEGHDPSGTVLLRILEAVGAKIVPGLPVEIPHAVNAELRELRRDLEENADREASRHDDLLDRIEALTGDLRVVSAALAGRSSPNG